jgi:phenylacetate-CoA ligase
VGIYGTLLSRWLHPAWERYRGRPTTQHLTDLERTQWLATDELEALQGRLLRRLVEHACRHVPHYRELLSARELTPAHFSHPSDLARLPILDRDAAIRAGDRRKSMGTPGCDLLKTTGGTTGQPLRFGMDLGSEHWRHAVKLRGWGWSGYRVGERTLYYWGPATTRTPPLKTRVKVAADHLFKRERYVDCTVRDEAHLATVVALLRQRRTQRLICYTQAGVDLARFVVERGLRDWRDMPVLCCAERLEPNDRNLLALAFGPEIYETYGCREVMLIGAECPAHEGLHTSMENLIVEVVVRTADGTRPARPGETGEVLLTDLHNFGMPFIRYANGDLATPMPDQRCACGRGLKRLASVEGRVAETIRDACGRPVCGILFSRIFSWSEALARIVRHWQVVQHADGAITLRLEASRELDAAAREDLRRSLDRYLPGVAVRTERVDFIPPAANGKRRTVLVEPSSTLH